MASIEKHLCVSYSFYILKTLSLEFISSTFTRFIDLKLAFKVYSMCACVCASVHLVVYQMVRYWFILAAAIDAGNGHAPCFPVTMATPATLPILNVKVP